jgi:glycosyltransferase involved in cell wall biosynthesis
MEKNSKMSNILLSVIVPCYNQVKFLNDCLKSVQDLERLINLEIIVVDDGSKFDVHDLVYSTLYNFDKNRIRIFKNSTNQGVSFSRNTGLKLATGKYVYFLDSDDYLNPRSIEKAIGFMEESNLKLLIGSYLIKSEKTSMIKNTFDFYYLRRIKNGTQNVFNLIDNQSIMNIWGLLGAKLFDRDFLLRNNIEFDTEQAFFEDYLFFIKALSRNMRIGWVLDPLYTYRVATDHQVTSQNELNYTTKIVNSSAKAILWCYENKNEKMDLGIAQLHVLGSLFSTLKRSSRKLEFIRYTRSKINSDYFLNFHFSFRQIGKKNKFILLKNLIVFGYFKAFVSCFTGLIKELPELILWVILFILKWLKIFFGISRKTWEF